ncbi:PLDc_N domain-containing protein [Micrococcales bacterium 31B]|nr:PLDc_N domain-containing protein [Micrococcales bacterium 31B]
MARALFILLWLGMSVYGITDIINTPAHRCRYMSKSTWAVIAVIVPIVGTAAWLYFGKVREYKPSPRQVAPDDDPDFLASLRTRKPQPGPVPGPSVPPTPPVPLPPVWQQPPVDAPGRKAGAAEGTTEKSDSSGSTEQPERSTDEDRDGDQAARN